MKRCVNHFVSVMFLSVMMLSSCATEKPDHSHPDDAAYAPVLPQKAQPNAYRQGSIVQLDDYRSVYSDTSSHSVGDILTVLLSEKTNGQKTANTNLRRNSAMLYQPGIQFVNANTGNVTGGSAQANINAASNFQGQGNSVQSNSLIGTITVSVVRVLSNGYLLVRGEKWITINRGREYIRLTGIVRPQDITQQNTVYSGQIGNARIQYSGTGQFSDSNDPGWITRLMQKIS